MAAIQQDEFDLSVARCRVALAREPFWGKIVSALDVTASEKIATAAVSANGAVLINRQWWSALTREQKLFVFAHEAYHWAFNHVARRQKRRPDLWAFAIDAHVNLVLKMERIGEMPNEGIKPDYRWLASSGAVMAPEEIYTVILAEEDTERRRIENERQWGKGKDDGSKDDGDRDDGDDAPALTEDERKEIEEELKRRLNLPKNFDAHSTAIPTKAQQRRSAITLAAAISAAIGAGNLPKAISEEIGEGRAAHIGWRELLSAHLNAIDQSDFDWTVPNRRQEAYRDIIMPGLRSPYHRGIIIALDVSGSIASEQLNDAAASTLEMVQSINPEAWIVQFDTHVYETSVQHIEHGQPMQPVRTRYGIGGTSFIDVFRWAKENVPDCPAIIIFTDGDGSYPSEDDPNLAPLPPTLWIMGGYYHRKTAPFGTVIEMKD